MPALTYYFNIYADNAIEGWKKKIDRHSIINDLKLNIYNSPN
jgi:hypothetical protein